jgi:hypothetical protein
VFESPSITTCNESPAAIAAMGKELNNKNTYGNRYLIRFQTARFLLAKLRLLSEKFNLTYKKEEKFG